MQARFVTDTATVNVNPVQVTGNVSVKSGSVEGKAKVKTTVVITDHEGLSGRDSPDQHPIGAISGLQDVLDKLWTFTFEQSMASDTWTIEHNLGRNPSVVVVDSAGNVFYPAVQYINENQLVVTMNGETTGKAYLN